MCDMYIHIMYERVHIIQKKVRINKIKSIKCESFYDYVNLNIRICNMYIYHYH